MTIDSLGIKLDLQYLSWHNHILQITLMFCNSQHKITLFWIMALGLALLAMPVAFISAQATTCQDECAIRSAKQCLNGSNYRVCGNYDSDSCLEWSDFKVCSSNTTCFNGQCVANSQCQGDCQWDTISQCVGSGAKQICQSYSKQNGLCSLWGPLVNCAGGSSCGYGQCSSQEIPEWSCDNGHCVYKCKYSSNCSDTEKYSYLACSSNDVYWYSSNGARQEKKQECQSEKTTCEQWSGNYCNGNSLERFRICYKRGCNNGQCYEEPYTEKQTVKQCDQSQFCSEGLCHTCQCLSGPCCDGCQFKTANEVCNTQKIQEYACPWGEGCQSDIGLREQAGFQKCSGKNSACDGPWVFTGLTNWLKAKECPLGFGCSQGQSTCQAKINCSTATAQIPKPKPINNQTNNSTTNSTSSNITPAIDSTATSSEGAHQNNSISSQSKANKNRGVAFLVLSGLGKGLISWYFWLLMTLLAIGFIVAKYAKLSDWQAKKELERISRQHNQS